MKALAGIIPRFLRPAFTILLMVAFLLPSALSSSRLNAVENAAMGFWELCAPSSDSAVPGDMAAEFCALCKLPATGSVPCQPLAVPARIVSLVTRDIGSDSFEVGPVPRATSPRAPPIVPV